MRLIVPPTGNQFIAMLKDSSLVSVVGVWELTKTAQVLVKRDFQVFEFLIAASVLYCFLSFFFVFLQSRIVSYYFLCFLLYHPFLFLILLFFSFSPPLFSCSLFLSPFSSSLFFFLLL